ncbi:hypothetical protein PPYR_12748 [Photinus pyralis]|uniref:Pacifastin domain-containing protein n=2 Tax=Photinus pyralis TaxID=7054 RepID=A0A5N4A794_PHOPY|nr:hypothetical protein PPYR_12748 [Photinus pyralis]
MNTVCLLCLGMFAVVIADKPRCTIGETKRDECAICDCLRLQDGSIDWYCTQYDCYNPHDELLRKATTCKIGETKHENCALCECMTFQNGITDWFCTQADCHFDERSKRSSPTDTANGECSEGETKTEKCRTCKCINNETKTRTMWTCYDLCFP